MSRILKNKDFIACMILFLLAIGVAYMGLWPLSLVFLAAVAVIIVNIIAQRPIYKSLRILHNRTTIKEFDTLVIGDYCDMNDIEINISRTAFFQSADRSYAASYQIFMHVHSLLNNGGRLIFINDTSVNPDAITIFDVLYLHPITRKELKIENLTNKIRKPFIFEPIKTLKNVLKLKKRGFKQAECKNGLHKFCEERNIELIYLEK